MTQPASVVLERTTLHGALRLEPPELSEQGFDTEAFSQVFRETVSVLDRASIAYAVIGGIASTGYGRTRWTHDIDILVKPEDAERTLACLERAAFRIERTDPRWLYKAFKDDVMVDVIFRSTGEIRLDDEMIARAVEIEFLGCRPRFIPAEDLLVMKALVHDEGGTRHWHDALGIISANNLDWPYLLRRARRAPRRVLSLLIYAHSLDLHVPNRVIRALFEEVYGEWSMPHTDKYLEARIREALATDDRTNYLDPQITIAAGKVFLMGEVESEERRSFAEVVTREITPAGMQIINEISVESYTTPAMVDERI